MVSYRRVLGLWKHPTLNCRHTGIGVSVDQVRIAFTNAAHPSTKSRVAVATRNAPSGPCEFSSKCANGNTCAHTD